MCALCTVQRRSHRTEARVGGDVLGLLVIVVIATQRDDEEIDRRRVTLIPHLPLCSASPGARLLLIVTAACGVKLGQGTCAGLGHGPSLVYAPASLFAEFGFVGLPW